MGRRGIMTKEQALEIFGGIYPNYKHDDDYYKVQFAWTCFIDSLCKSGEITQRQFDTWGNPIPEPKG